MKDCTGKEIKRGCILKDKDGDFRRVDYVGSERIITARMYEDFEKTEQSSYFGTSWKQDEINDYKLTIVAYRKLEVTDKNGHDLRENDEVKVCSSIVTIFEGIKSKNGDGRDWVLYYTSSFDGGWTSYQCIAITFHSRPSDEPKLDIKVTINGKPMPEPMSIETAKRWGIVR